MNSLIVVAALALGGGSGTLTSIEPDGQVRVSRAVVSKPKASYPVRGSHWSYPGNSRGQLIAHLQSGEHAGKFSPTWLNSLSYAELLSLHDDDHEHRVKMGSTIRAERVEAKKIGRAMYGTRDGKHPGPVGAWIRGSFGDPRYSNCPGGYCPR